MDPAHARQLLTRERARVEEGLAGLGPGPRDASDPAEASDPGPELIEAEIDFGLAGRLRDELEAIERAERRLEAGDYGRSVESGDPIPDGRLEAIPWAERTTEEQARFDRRAG